MVLYIVTLDRALVVENQLAHGLKRSEKTAVGGQPFGVVSSLPTVASTRHRFRSASLWLFVDPPDSKQISISPTFPSQPVADFLSLIPLLHIKFRYSGIVTVQFPRMAEISKSTHS
jgi:hypothetical protein